ncbi:HD domain-containing protein [Maritimibacter sp. DP1N21-5]|uniref:HD domain-containing protein n=1 Tax=Maritimibacter sp. DP1N21-5 TaxID=2836867 RepID=UPI001C46631A|nr:HD domain-containing protein [Maritimibacter sp. DP1N21-5]MBV7409469.1 HD domain-containing protein [Maritimibacter sp. DP1N21-5]
MLTHRFDDAFALAARLHRSHQRKVSNVPYLSHLMAVSALVLENGGDEDQAIAGLLHDAVEDQGGQATADLIRAAFGDRVADIVLACSDAVDQSSVPWQARKDGYLASLATKGEDALLVTSCDKLHNATTIYVDLLACGPAVFDRFTTGRDGTLWYYRALADRLCALRPGPLSDRIAEVVARIEARA